VRQWGDNFGFFRYCSVGSQGENIAWKDHNLHKKCLVGASSRKSLDIYPVLGVHFLPSEDKISS